MYERRIKKGIFGEGVGVSLISYFSMGKTLGTGYDIYQENMRGQRGTLPVMGLRYVIVTKVIY